MTHNVTQSDTNYKTKMLKIDIKVTLFLIKIKMY